MAEKNMHSSGVGSFLSSLTQEQARQENAQQIVRIDIDRLVVNVNNFYGMRDVDELAGDIAVTNTVEPLMVTEAPEDKFLLIAGHRRLAAWKKLLEQGVVTDHTLPCVIRRFDPVTFEKSDGTKVEFTSDQMANVYLVLSNRGQRKTRTVFEQIKEIKVLKPIAEAVYDDMHKKKTIRGNFRRFFAEDILNVSASVLQRKMSLEKLSEDAIQAIQDGLISETAAVELTSLPHEKQDEYIQGVREGKYTGKTQSIKEELRQLLGISEEDEEPEEDDAPDIHDEPEDENTEPTDADDDEPEESEEGFEPPREAPEEREPSDESSREPAQPESHNASEPQEASASADDSYVVRHVPLPEHMGDPQEEVEQWWDEIMAPVWKEVEYAKEQQAAAVAQDDKVLAARWGARVAFATLRIACFEENMKSV